MYLLGLMGGFYTNHKSVIEFKRFDVLKCRFTGFVNLLFRDETLILVGHVHGFSLLHSLF